MKCAYWSAPNASYRSFGFGATIRRKGFVRSAARKATKNGISPWSQSAYRLFFVSIIKDHRKRAHRTEDLNEWFDCAECERIEAEYAKCLSERATTP